MQTRVKAVKCVSYFRNFYMLSFYFILHFICIYMQYLWAWDRSMKDACERVRKQSPFKVVRWNFIIGLENIELSLFYKHPFKRFAKYYLPKLKMLSSRWKLINWKMWVLRKSGINESFSLIGSYSFQSLKLSWLIPIIWHHIVEIAQIVLTFIFSWILLNSII